MCEDTWGANNSSDGESDFSEEHENTDAESSYEVESPIQPPKKKQKPEPPKKKLVKYGESEGTSARYDYGVLSHNQESRFLSARTL